MIKAFNGEAVIVKPNTGNSFGDVISIYDSNFITIQDIIFDGTNISTYVVRTGGASGNNRSSYITWQGCTARFGPKVGFAEQGNSGDNNHIKYINCIAHHNGTTSLHHGFYPSSSVGTVIDGCVSYNNSGHGIHVFASTGTGLNDFVIKNNKIYSNGSYGIGLYYGANQLVYNNLVYGNGVNISGSGGIRVGNGSNFAKVYNNTVYGNTGTGVMIEPGADGTTIRNVISYLNSTSNIFNSGTHTVSSNNLTTNPNFVGAGVGDFHLQAGSTAIDGGATISEVTDDFDGVSRPQGGGVDIGAFEYTNAQQATPPNNLRIVGTQ